MSYTEMTNAERVEATKTWAAPYRMVRRGRVEAKVMFLDPGIPGAVFLDKPIEGLRWWNVSELQPSKAP